MMPMVASVAPARRTTSSSERAVLTPSGWGRPCGAFEDNGPKATADEARQRPFRIRPHSLEQEFILTRKERVNIRQYFLPIVKRFIGDGEVRVDGNKPPLVPTERRDECALHVDGHRREVAG